MKRIILAALVGVLVSGPVWAENKYGTVCSEYESYAVFNHVRLEELREMTGNQLEGRGMQKEHDDLAFIRLPNIIQLMNNLGCDLDALKYKLDATACKNIIKIKGIHVC